MGVCACVCGSLEPGVGGLCVWVGMGVEEMACRPGQTFGVKCVGVRGDMRVVGVLWAFVVERSSLAQAQETSIYQSLAPAGYE